MKEIMISKIFLILMFTASFFAQCIGKTRVGDPPNPMAKFNKFNRFDSLWGYYAAHSSSLDHNLRLLSDEDCMVRFPGCSELCYLFKWLKPEITSCDLRTLRHADFLRYELDEIEGKKQTEPWRNNRLSSFAGAQHEKSALRIANRCSSEINQEVQRYMSSPSAAEEKLLDLNQIIDFEKKCANPKEFRLLNKQISRRDVKSLECAIEVIRRQVSNPNVANILLAKKTLNKLRKIIGFKGGLLYKSNEIGEQFMEHVALPCDRFIDYDHSSIAKAAILYRSIPLHDKYFESIPMDSKFFDLLKTALICKEIVKNAEEIRERIGFPSMSCGK